MEDFESDLLIRETLMGKDSPYALAVVDQLAAGYEKNGDYAKAEVMAKRAFSARDSANSSDKTDIENIELAASISRLADIYAHDKRYVEALALYDRSLNLYEKFLPGSAKTYDILNDKAKSLYMSGKSEEAELVYKRIREQPSQKTKASSCADLNNQGAKALDAGNYTEAIAKFENAIKLDTNYVLARVNLTSAYYNPGRLAYNKADYLKAESLFKYGVVIGETVAGPCNPLFQCMIVLGMIYHQQDQYEKAADICKKLLNFIDAKECKLTDQQYKDFLIEYAVVLRKLNKSTEAVQLENRAKLLDLKTGK